MITVFQSDDCYTCGHKRALNNAVKGIAAPKFKVKEIHSNNDILRYELVFYKKEVFMVGKVTLVTMIL